MIKVILFQYFINHWLWLWVCVGVEPGFPDVKRTPAPISSLQLKFSRVRHSCHPWPQPSHLRHWRGFWPGLKDILPFLGDPCILFCGIFPSNSFFLGEKIPSLPFAFPGPTVALFIIMVNDSICCLRSFNSLFSLSSITFSTVIALAFIVTTFSAAYTAAKNSS